MTTRVWLMLDEHSYGEGSTPLGIYSSPEAALAAATQRWGVAGPIELLEADDDGDGARTMVRTLRGWRGNVAYKDYWLLLPVEVDGAPDELR